MHKDEEKFADEEALKKSRRSLAKVFSACEDDGDVSLE